MDCVTRLIQMRTGFHSRARWGDSIDGVVTRTRARRASFLPGGGGRIKFDSDRLLDFSLPSTGLSRARASGAPPGKIHSENRRSGHPVVARSSSSETSIRVIRPRVLCQLREISFYIKFFQHLNAFGYLRARKCAFACTRVCVTICKMY